MAAFAATEWQDVLIPVVAAGLGSFTPFVAPRLREFVRNRYATRKRTQLVREAATTGPRDDSQTGGVAREALENVARDPLRGPRLYLASLDVEAFRCFDSAHVDLHYPGDTSQLTHSNVNLILGDNGAGKSTVLKAVALAALGPVLDSSGFAPYHLVRANRPESSLSGRFLSDQPSSAPRELVSRVRIARAGDYEKVVAQEGSEVWSRLFDDSDPSFLVVGYGVNRRAAEGELDRATLERSRRRRRYQRVASLFDESAVLTPLSAWLGDVKYARRREVERLLTSLLPRATNLRDDIGTDVVFRHRGMDIPYRALSDGYKSFIAWVGDLLFQIHSVTDGSVPLDEIGGIVLVDEVDLLLHPSWQREVVPSIARALPKLQFVFTTHSPIVAGTLESGNILIARDTDEGATLERVDAWIHGLNAEQILLSSYFEMESTRAPGVQSELNTLARRAMDGDDDAALTYLRSLAAKSTPEDRNGE